MTHRYIDEHCVAERYLQRALPPQEHDAFESHLVECDECTDRLLLAQIFLDHKAIGTARTRFATAREPAVRPAPSGWSAARPGSPDVVANAAASANGRVPRVTAPSVPARERILREQPEPEWPDPEWPKRAQFVAQFTPWQLFFLAVGAALWLLLVPTAYFLGQLTRINGTR
jgi:hypothetical protein